MSKKTWLYVAVGFSVCLAIVAFSLSLYFGLRDDDDDGNQYPGTQTTTTTTTTTTMTTDPLWHKNDGSERTPLDDYVYSEESLLQFDWFHAEEYDVNETSIITNETYSAYILNMTSGYWLTEEEVGDRHRWWHIFMVIIPDNLRTDYQSNGFIWVTHNSNTRNGYTGLPDMDDEYIHQTAAIATGVGMPAALLFQVPNQAFYFASDPTNEKCTEDEIIAYSWNMYLKNMTNPELNAYFPMVRAAVRAMDTFTQFMKLKFDITTDGFMFAGNSKRGWTSWLAGAMDQYREKKRIKGIVPVVWDAINIQEVFQEQWKSFNGWSFAIEDYYYNNITTKFGSPEVNNLQNMIDPYFYRTRLTIPKLVVTGLMDEFQMADDEQHWWDEMPSGPTGQGLSDGNTKWLLKNPNAEHQSTNFRTSLFTIGRWVSYLLNDWDIPYLTWDYDPESGDITAHTHLGEVVSASMWHATTCNDTRRDFRAASLDFPCYCGVYTGDDDVPCLTTTSWWYETPLAANPDDGASYTAHVEPPPDDKWTAIIIHVQMITNYTLDADNPKHNFFTRGDDAVLSNVPEPFYPTVPAGAFEFSTRASVVPNFLPYPGCTLEECDGPMV